MTSEPDEVQKIAAEEAQRHPNDIEVAVSASVTRVRRLPMFEELVDHMIRLAVRGIVTDCRHHANVTLRRKAGEYGGPAKVKAGRAVDAVAADYYAYFIAGRTLGNILGKELAEIGEAEAKRAEGYQFNALLCERLASLVPEGKTVKQAVKPGRLRAMFATLQKKKEDGRAA